MQSSKSKTKPAIMAVGSVLIVGAAAGFGYLAYKQWILKRKLQKGTPVKFTFTASADYPDLSVKKGDVVTYKGEVSRVLDNQIYNVIWLSIKDTFFRSAALDKALWNTTYFGTDTVGPNYVPDVPSTFKQTDLVKL